MESEQYGISSRFSQPKVSSSHLEDDSKHYDADRRTEESKGDSDPCVNGSFALRMTRDLNEASDSEEHGDRTKDESDDRNARADTYVLPD